MIKNSPVSNFESLGQFNLQDPAMWDKAISMTLSGLTGITAAALIALALNKYLPLKKTTPETTPLIDVLFKKNFSLWFLIVLGLAASYLNYAFSLNFIGIKSSIDNRFLSLIWSFFINHGFILITTYFIYYNFAPPTFAASYLLMYLILTCAISTSRLSRSFIFYFTPVYYVICMQLSHRHSLTKANVAKLGTIFVAFLLTVIISTKVVNDLRDYKFNIILGNPTPQETSSQPSYPLNVQQAAVVIDTYSNEIQKMGYLFIGRFIGLEGILASAAYKEASPNSLYEAFRNNVEDNVSYYDQHVISSNYQNTNSDKVKFGTLPGLIGFMAISGNHFVIFLGCLLVTLICFMFEFASRRLTTNFFANAYFSGFLALGVSQFGFQPLHLFVHFITIIVFIFGIEIVLNFKHNFKRITSLSAK